MKTHTLTVRDRRLSWDDRTLVRGSVAADRVEVALDDEYKACDTVHAVMVSAAHPEPVRMVVEGGAYSIPSELTRETGSILTCLIGYVGEVQRVTSEQESQPLVVTKSGPVCGTDPEQEQPDLWAQLIATVESAERIAQSVRDDADSGKFNGKDGKPGAPGTPGAPGDKGDPGAPGKDGISPSAKVEQTADGATVSITDKDGTTTATIRNGAKGDPGDKGDPGNDGTSPTASVNRTDTGAVITVTDASGTTSAEVLDGRDGETVIPDLGVTNVKIADNAVNTRTIADGSVTRAKMAQDALPKAGAGISIADDGTVGFNGNKGTFYFENDGKVNILSNAFAKGTLNGTTYFSGVSTPTENSTGSVQWFVAGQVVVIAPREAVTLSVPAEWPTSAKLAFATLATGRKILKPIANARIAQLVCDEGWFYMDADVATDGTVTLSLFVPPKQAGTAIHIKQTGFTQLVLPICGGGALGDLGQRNYWLKIIDSAVNGVKFEMQPDGGIRCTGSSGGNWTASKQNFARLEDMGVWPGDSMRLDNLGGGSAQVRAIFMRQNGMDTETLVNNNRSRVVPQDAVSVALDVVFRNMQGQTIDEVVYPMLVKGTERPSNYVPYF